MTQMTLTRRQTLAIIAGALVLPRCGIRSRSSTVTIGSKNFAENILIAEIYAQALKAVAERHFTVERRFDLGDTLTCTKALLQGSIDVYPEYIGTGLLDVLGRRPLYSPETIALALRDAYRKCDLTWLQFSPASDSQGIATTSEMASQGLRRLTDCAARSNTLRLQTFPEFVRRADGLPALRKVYGHFRFKEVNFSPIGVQYEALLWGAADVATVFTSDPQICEYKLVLLTDNRHAWPPYNVAPVARFDLLRSHKGLQSTLNDVSLRLTEPDLLKLNHLVAFEKTDPFIVAHKWLSGSVGAPLLNC